MAQCTHKASSTASLLLFVLLHLSIKASCMDTLKQGENFNSSSQLDSPNGLFTLKFHTVEGTNATYLALLFNGRISQAVWIGNRYEPIPNNSAPSLSLGTRGDLTITRRDGGDPVRLFAGAPQPINATATLSDAGNFLVQVQGGNNNQFLWQSFDRPTDTLLSEMKLGGGGADKISSWLSPTDPAPGAFTLEWEPASGELVIRRRGTAYWRSGPLKDYYDKDLGNVKGFENFLPRPDLDFNFNLTSEGEFFMFSVIPVAGERPDDRKNNSGWRLDSTGTLETVDSVRGIYKNMAVASLCYGYNSGGTGESRGCQEWPQPKCRNRFQSFEERSGIFRYANNRVVMTTTTTDEAGSNLSMSDCREACWRNCECVGYSNLAYGCTYWIGKDLVWDQDNLGLTTTKYVLQSSEKEKKNRIGIILGVVGAVALLLTLGLAYFVVRSRKVKREEELHDLLTLEGQEGNYELENRGAKAHHHLKIFSYGSILSATANFSSSNKLGEGGFGPVYKGRTAEGQDIAVKLLSRQSGQGLIEFKNELVLISELQHVNLVKLPGFCIHKDEKMIVYDYMPNKSLDCFLFDPSKREQLDWRKRFNIIEGTAQGLLYLHKYSRLKIIHRDMKPNNILLDENMTPKISDFGLARIFKEDVVEANTNRRVGTYGYMAPEYAMQGMFSVKSDVYSFGVLVLEIVSGRRNSSFHEIEGPLSIVEYAWEMWRKDCALELMDPMLKDSCIIEQLQKCIQIGLLCVENHAVDRPTIEDVVSMLKNETVTLPVPSNPAFVSRNSVFQQMEKAQKSTSSNEVRFSANQVTLSEMDGR